jgi:hypothetical protein
MTKTAKKTKLQAPAASEPPLVNDADVTVAGGSAKPKSKTAALAELLRQPGGARIEEMMAATGWQAQLHPWRHVGRIEDQAGLDHHFGDVRNRPSLSDHRGGDRGRRMTIDDQVRALEDLGLEPLRAEWRARFGAPPGLRSVDLLRRLLAWKIQTGAYGDLDAGLRRRVRTGVMVRKNDGQVGQGARLVREWQGRRYEVDVVEGGFVQGGARYASLSQVARAITGTRWNGPRFFGLRDGGAG